MKKLINKMDKPLFIVTTVYLIFGLLMIFSSSSISSVLRYRQSQYLFFLKQAAFIAASFFIGFTFILRIDIRWYKKILPYIVIGIIVALVGLFFYGTVVNDAQSWYSLGLFSVQPSEFAKTVIVLYFALYFSEKQKSADLPTFLRPLAVGILVVGLVFAQPDIGGAAIIATLIFLLLIAIPLPKNNKIQTIRTIMIAFVIIGGIALYFGGDTLLKNKMSRFTFKDPCTRYTENTGYQVCNSLIAVSNGGLFGKGLGDSSQKYLYLPESHTDFIYPIISEELGAIAAIVVLLGYLYILWRILKIAKESENLRNSIIAYGTFLILVLHILINLVGVLSLLPLTGVPLPFLSYGGSFTSNIIILLFLVQRVNIENKMLKTKKEINNL